MKPWLDDGDVRFYHGSAIDVLAALPERSVQTCVCSPPYWGLRDYGTGEWTGGDPECDHLQKVGGTGASTLGAASGGNDMSDEARERSTTRSYVTYPDTCGKCGARRVDRQLGLEPTPDEYVANMVAVFREVRRVLRDDGTVWLNLGDSYAGGGGFSPGSPSNVARREAHAAGIRKDGGFVIGKEGRLEARKSAGKPPPGLKQKDLVGVPWMVAFALRADGWYLRAENIWAKPNPMPESVRDRTTRAHETVFLLSKQAHYYYDIDAVREPHKPDGRTKTVHDHATPNSHPNYDNIAQGRERWPGTGRNMRSVWEITTQPTPEAHFATYPEELVRRCILAGTSEAGECSVCGAPWRRIVEADGESVEQRLARQTKRVLPDRIAPRSDGGLVQYAAGRLSRPDARRETKGWEPTCACDAPARPQIVLDPFIGSGTTALVARRHGRRAWGIDLNADYLQIAARRTQQLSLLSS